MSTFSQVNRPYTFGGGGGSLKMKTKLCYTFNFLAWFLLFSWGFWHSKMSICNLFGEGGVSESLWFVHSWKCWHLWKATKTIIYFHILMKYLDKWETHFDSISLLQYNLRHHSFLELTHNHICIGSGHHIHTCFHNSHQV